MRSYTDRVRQTYQAAKNRTASFYSNFMNLFRETAAEVLVCGALGLATGVGVAYHSEFERNKMIPLGFSEMEQIEKDAKYKGVQLGPMNVYLPAVNDATMKIFECWNLANDRVLGNVNRIFATELEIKIDPSLNFYKYSILDFAT